MRVVRWTRRKLITSPACPRSMAAGSSIDCIAGGLTAVWRNGLPTTAVDAWIVHSGFHRDLLRSVGIPESRITVRLHTLDQPPAISDGPGNHALFVGRLAQGKGIELLASAWPRDLPLTVMGGGPLAHVAQTFGAGYVGPQPSSAVAKAMGEARFLAVTSQVYEGGGLWNSNASGGGF